MKPKVCRAFDRYGLVSPDCEWLFKPKSGRQIYCEPCQVLIQREQNRLRVEKCRGKITLDYILSTHDYVWKASWIEKRCSCCGEKGVPTFNRFLCYPCWSTHTEMVYEAPFIKEDREHAAEDHGPVKQYSSRDYTQEELQAILDGGVGG